VFPSSGAGEDTYPVGSFRSLDPVSEMSYFLVSRIPDEGKVQKKKPVILSVIHDRRNPLESIKCIIENGNPIWKINQTTDITAQRKGNYFKSVSFDNQHNYKSFQTKVADPSEVYN
jgi:hypothetical protein